MMMKLKDMWENLCVIVVAIGIAFALLMTVTLLGGDPR